MVEDTANGGVPTTTVYQFEASPNLKQITYEYDNKTITYRRIDAPSDNEHRIPDVPLASDTGGVRVDVAVSGSDTDSPVRKEKGYYLL
jgi:hypothetical protein